MRPPDATPLARSHPARRAPPRRPRRPGRDARREHRRHPTPPPRPGPATGAKYVRVFAQGDQLPDYATFKGIALLARGRGMNVVFVLTGNADGTNRRRTRATFANVAAEFAAQIRSVGGAAAYEVWNEEDETDFWGAAVDAARYAAILKAAYPPIKQADPGAKVLLGPLTGNNYNFLGQVYAAGAGGSFDAVGGPHRHRLPRRSAELLLPRGRQRRALHLPGLPHRPRRDGRQRRRRQADLDDRAGLDDHDVDLHARHVGRPEGRGRHRGRAGRQPQGGLPLPRRLSLRRDRRCGSRSRTPRGTATSSTTTACSAPTTRTSPRGTPSARSPRRATSSAGRAATSTRRR